MMIIFRLIALLLITTSVFSAEESLSSKAGKYYALTMNERFDIVDEKVRECEYTFNCTKRSHLEHIFCNDIIREINTFGITYKELSERISGFNERLFDELLSFCSNYYRGEPYIILLTLKVGEIKIKDQLSDRISELLRH